MLDLQRLRVFRAVVASGSVQAAATHLGYTPSAVSQQVGALQRETGLSLLVRSGRGVEPTTTGRELAARIDILLGEVGRVNEFVVDQRDGRSGSLRLTFMASAGSAWLPGVVGALDAEFPQVRIHLEVRDDLVVGGPGPRPDVQVVVAPEDLAAPPGHRAELLLRDPYVAVVPADHPVAGATAVRLADLAEEAWIDNDLGHGYCRQLVLEAASAVGFAPPFRFAVHDYVTAMAFVRHGLGVTIVPGLGARQNPPGTVAVPVVDPTPVRSIHAVTLTAAEGVPACRRALDLLHEAARR